MENSCEICKTASRKYQCPKCNIQYCSVSCYRNELHSTCSEEFYKLCIKEELRSRQEEGTNVNCDEMLSILKAKQDFGEMLDCISLDDLVEEEDKNIDSDDDSVDDEEIDLAERLDGIDLNDVDSVWSSLSKCEKLQFEEFVRCGDVSSVLPEFDPWWKGTEVIKGKDGYPRRSVIITPFDKLSKSRPSSLVCNNVANILAAYTLAVRLYNGDHHDHVEDATVTMVVTSKTLSNNESFPDFESAIQSFYLEVTGCEFLKGCVDGSDFVKSDVRRLFQGPTDNFVLNSCYVVLALNDIHELFSSYVKSLLNNASTAVSKVNGGEFSKRFKDHSIFESTYSVPKTKVKLMLKKIEYYLSWAGKHYTKPIMNVE